MVRILPSGEIVADDDPRVSSMKRTTATASDQRVPRANLYAEPVPNGQSVSLFDNLNNRLLAFGIPRWNLGTVVVEPLISVALLLSILFFGLPALILVVILYVVSQMSNNGGSLSRVIDSVLGRGGGATTQTGQSQRGGGVRTQNSQSQQLGSSRGPANSSRPPVSDQNSKSSQQGGAFPGVGNKLT